MLSRRIKIDALQEEGGGIDTLLESIRKEGIGAPGEQGEVSVSMLS
jgi:hypothetical protein